MLISRSSSIPLHLQFEKMDIEEPWSTKVGTEGPYDLIHIRTLNGSISHWPFVYDQIYKSVLQVFSQLDPLSNLFTGT